MHERILSLDSSVSSLERYDRFQYAYSWPHDLLWFSIAVPPFGLLCLGFFLCVSSWDTGVNVDELLVAVGDTQLRKSKVEVQQTQQKNESQMNQGLMQLTELAYRMGQWNAAPQPPPKKPLLALEDKRPDSSEEIWLRYPCQYWLRWVCRKILDFVWLLWCWWWIVRLVIIECERFVPL